MIYLDQAATRYPRPVQVREAVKAAVDAPWGNPGRSGHGLAMAANRAVFESRVAVAELLGVDPLHIIFASSGTDALNLLVHGLPVASRVASTSVEHNSVLRPLRDRASRRELNLHIVVVDAAGRVDLTQPAPACDVFMVTAASNVLAGRNDLAALRDWLGPEVRLFVDGAQLVGEIPAVDYVAYVDAIAAPGHKALGAPPGSGLVYVQPRVALRPWKQGGTGSRSESADQPDDRPDGFEAGSQNLWGIVGLGVAARCCDPAQWQSAEKIAQQLRNELSDSDRYRIVGARGGACAPLVCFVPRQAADINQLGANLWHDYGIAVRTGLHCAPGAHAHAGTLETGAMRASFGPEHTEADLETLLRALYAVRA